VADRVASLCAAPPARRVIEIGAGAGILTEALLRSGAHVTALELDPDLVALLRSLPALGAAAIHHADALTFDYESETAGEPWCAAGNLPYNIATPLLVRWLSIANPPARIVAMVQRDVAGRLNALPGTRAYGSLSVLVRYWTEPRRAFVLGPSHFYPRPKVESAVVVLQRRSEPAVRARDQTFFLQVVRAAFAYRRKTLANSLALALGIERRRTHEALAKLALDSEVRGEQLDLGAFASFADSLAP
jgi:16S rRNA (adenine1518-N6/adenine1519-N6)-dimethyltransferase